MHIQSNTPDADWHI